MIEIYINELDVKIIFLEQKLSSIYLLVPKEILLKALNKLTDKPLIFL